MSKEFKYLKFGLVPADLSSQTLSANNQVLKSFLSTFDGQTLLNETESHKEVFTVARSFIGEDFRNWLIVNFRHGCGARKELARKIVGYCAGRYSGSIVIEQIKIDLNRISFLKDNEAQIKDMIIYDESDMVGIKWRVEDVDFSEVENRHFFDFCALIGPELMAKFCLSLDGIYGRRFNS